MKLLIDNLPPALRDQQAVLQACMDALARARPVREVILFGSYARGDQRPESDLDLCVVAEDAEDQFAAVAAMRRELWGHEGLFAVSLIPITPARLAEKRALGDYFFATVLREGRRIAAQN
jgi:predicted nucleotidyltransferase